MSLVERVPKLLRILYCIKLGFLYRLSKQINGRFIYEKVKLHTYYLLETDFPALQGAHSISYYRLQCAYAPYGSLVHLYVNGCLPIVDQRFTFLLLLAEKLQKR